MRQPTKEENRSIDFAHADAAIAGGAHDLYVLELRRKYSVLGENTKLDPTVLTDAERAQLAGLEADAKTGGLQAQLAIVQLRKACEVSKDAMLIDGLWRSPITKQPYGEPTGTGS